MSPISQFVLLINHDSKIQISNGFRLHRGRELGLLDSVVGVSKPISGILNPEQVDPELEIESETI